MSLSGALSVALSGMQTSTTAVQIISGNITNAQTDGYTQKSINLAAVSMGSSLGGVEITSYSRLTNGVLFATLNSATSNASYLSTQNSYLSQGSVDPRFDRQSACAFGKSKRFSGGMDAICGKSERYNAGKKYCFIGTSARQHNQYHRVSNC